MNLIEIFKRKIPSPTQVIEEAIRLKLVPPYDDIEYIKSSFSILVEELQIDAYNLYLKAEEKEGMLAIREHLRGKVRSGATDEEAIEEAAKMFKELDRFFLSLTQSRRPRAGKAFEVILKTLFKRLEYPFDEQQVINGKPDFLMPNRIYYDRNAMDCIIFTAKRTLRERWRQIVTEGTRGKGFYLATIDESISKIQLHEMKAHRIYLVMPGDIKTRIPNYVDEDNVISYEEFFKYHLDPAVVRWRAKGII
ncbi:MAG: hypothetical protein A3H42_03380 [Deltaproteobacteria bacterium RIFCSPLOWO2_02_FULL_46_8]|nr:MAG: hypothetical protein A3H42_03380 [Deltaproteobacteria bacterium RIFCSPLOWO2_02_FULL_46_8]